MSETSQKKSWRVPLLLISLSIIIIILGSLVVIDQYASYQDTLENQEKEEQEKQFKTIAQAFGVGLGFDPLQTVDMSMFSEWSYMKQVALEEFINLTGNVTETDKSFGLGFHYMVMTDNRIYSTTKNEQFLLLATFIRHPEWGHKYCWYYVILSAEEVTDLIKVK